MASSLTLDTAPLFLQSLSYSASQASAPFTQAFHGEGVIGAQDLKISFSSGLGVNVAAGGIFIRGKNVSGQGTHKGTLTLAGGPLTCDASQTHGRLDQIVARLYDNTNDSSGQDVMTVEIVKGINADTVAGTTLDNRTTAKDLSTLTGSKSVVLLADLLIPGTSTETGTFGSASIRDRRPMGIFGNVPPLLANLGGDVVTMIAHPALAPQVGSGRADQTVHGGHQSCAAMWLPRDVLGANKVRWGYEMGDSVSGGGGHVSGGSYKFVICDATGRQIVATNSTAWSTSNGVGPALAETLAATTDFYRGLYYVWFGLSTDFADAGGGSVWYPSINLGSNWSEGGGDSRTPVTLYSIGQAGQRCGVPNLAFWRATGSMVFGDGGSNLNTIRYMTDLAGLAYNINAVPVPIISLSKE